MTINFVSTIGWGCIIQLCDLSDLLFVIECVLGGGVFMRVQRSYWTHSTPGGGWRLKGLVPLGSTHDTTSFSNCHPWNWVNGVNLKIIINCNVYCEWAIQISDSYSTQKETCSYT